MGQLQQTPDNGNGTFRPSSSPLVLDGWSRRAVGGRHPDLGLIEMYSKSVFQEPCGALTYRAREVCTPVLFHRVPVHSEKQMGEMVRDSACKELINKNLTSVFTDQCTMLPLSTKSCLKWSKLRPIIKGQFCHAISKNIGLNVLGSKQPREILVFVILKL